MRVERSLLLVLAAALAAVVLGWAGATCQPIQPGCANSDHGISALGEPGEATVQVAGFGRALSDHVAPHGVHLAAACLGLAALLLGLFTLRRPGKLRRLTYSGAGTLTPLRAGVSTGRAVNAHRPLELSISRT